MRLLFLVSFSLVLNKRHFSQRRLQYAILLPPLDYLEALLSTVTQDGRPAGRHCFLTLAVLWLRCGCAVAALWLRRGCVVAA